MEYELNIQQIANLIFKLFKWICVFVFIISIAGLAISVKNDYPLITNPIITTGNIVSFEGKHFSIVGRRNAGDMFAFNVAVVSFQDSKGVPRKVASKYGDTTRQIGEQVKVFYSRSNPDKAIIDLGIFHNWLTEYVWLFVMLASFLGIKRFSKEPKIE